MKNPHILAHPFLHDMQQDAYFPAAQVKKGQDILRRLCEAIEQQAPATLEQLYALTHAATEEFNLLGEEFEENGSELETAARENIGADFEFIAKAYGFEADVEELIANREW
jgi:cytochrome c556